MTETMDTTTTPSCMTVTLAWIANALGISHRTACRLNERREIPGRLDLGSARLNRYDRATIENWLRSLAK
jgi:predicted DNA-binding transcriptional regulator AlpA